MTSVVSQASQAEGEDETETVVTGLFSTPTVGAFKLKVKRGKKSKKAYSAGNPRGQATEGALGPYALSCVVYGAPLLCIRG